jgi:hypothetical protein
MGAGDIEHSGQANFHAAGFYFANADPTSGPITCTTDSTVSGRLVFMEATGFPTFIDSGAVEGDFVSGVFTATDLVTGTASGQITVSILAAGSTSASAPNGGETEQFELDSRFQIQDEATGSGNQSPSWSNGADFPVIAMAVIVGPAAGDDTLLLSRKAEGRNIQ